MDLNSVSGEGTDTVNQEHSVFSLSDAKLDELLTRVKDIQITMKSQSSKSILPPIAKPDEVVLNDERLKYFQFARSLLNEIIEKFDELTLKQL